MSVDDGVVAVYRNGEVVGHLSVELAHAASAAHRGHLLHTAHEFVLRDDHGRFIGRHRLERNVVVDLLVLGHLALEYRDACISCWASVSDILSILLLLDQLVDHVAVHTHETGLLVLRLVPVDIVVVELTVHQQHVVPLGLGRFEERVLLHGIVHIEEDDRTCSCRSGSP